MWGVDLVDRVLTWWQHVVSRAKETSGQGPQWMERWNSYGSHRLWKTPAAMKGLWFCHWSAEPRSPGDQIDSWKTDMRFWKVVMNGPMRVGLKISISLNFRSWLLPERWPSRKTRPVRLGSGPRAGREKRARIPQQIPRMSSTRKRVPLQKPRRRSSRSSRSSRSRQGARAARMSFQSVSMIDLRSASSVKTCNGLSLIKMPIRQPYRILRGDAGKCCPKGYTLR